MVSDRDGVWEVVVVASGSVMESDGCCWSL